MKTLGSGSLRTDNVSEGGTVIILSHDLEQYNVLPFSLKRDFGIKTVAHWYLKDDETQKVEFGGLKFREFLGKKVNGFFCPISSLLASGDLALYQPDDTKRVNLLQIIPDFVGYKQMARVIGELSGHQQVQARSFAPDDQIAQFLAEDCLLNVIGFLMCLDSLPGNPIPKISGSSIQEHVRKHKLLLEDASLMKFLREIGVVYSLFRNNDMSYGVDFKALTKRV